ncbi:MAG: RNA polymerase sigma factor [Gammaproteobacteria bacterium]|nr:RNA polymerase sigma factor [Gammaproteobacteria bacterium]
MNEPSCKAEQGYIAGIDERGWLARHLYGDKDAFPQLLGTYRRPVYNYLVRCGLDAASRDDLFQDIFLKIHAAAASYRPSQPLRAWVFTIAVNTVRNYWRASRNRFSVVDDGKLAERAAPGPGTDGTAETAETLAWLSEAVAALPIAHREVLVLVAIEGLPQQEVAEILDMPLNSVKTNLRRARLALLEEQQRRDAPVYGGDET